MKIIAITGSIGCGKTYLAKLLQEIGYSVYNPDKWVRFLYKNEKFINIIKINFPEVFDENGTFYKRKLRNLVFNNKDKLKLLESIIHPLLKRKLKKIINKKAKSEKFLFLDVALLYEMHWDIFCDYVIVADVDDDIQKQRVILRDNIKEEDFYKIIKNQIDKKIKNNLGDIVIDTGLKKGINKVQLIKFIEKIE